MPFAISIDTANHHGALRYSVRADPASIPERDESDRFYMSYEIQWHEGLFLLPQHLQAMQSSLHREIEQVRRSSVPFGSGLIELEVLNEQLDNNLLKLGKIQAVMPSGLALSYPGNAVLGSRDLSDRGLLKRGVITVYLAVPIWQESRQNTLKPGTNGARFRYASDEVMVSDENEGGSAKAVTFNKINACLLLDEDEREDFEILPILRLVPTASENGGGFKLDPEFSGICRSVFASEKLLTLVRGVTVNVENALAELRAVIGPRLASEVYAFDTVTKAMRLQTLARAAPRLRSLLSTKETLPYFWYLELAGLLGELSALHPDVALGVVPEFVAEDAILIFEEIVTKIRKILSTGISANHQKISFTAKGSYFVADLSGIDFDTVAEWYLLVKSTADAKAVADFVTNVSEFKLTVSKEILGSLPGVPLLLENSPPGFAVERGVNVFRLTRTWNRWPIIKTEHVLAAKWLSGRLKGDLSITLVALFAAK